MRALLRQLENTKELLSPFQGSSMHHKPGAGNFFVFYKRTGSIKKIFFALVAIGALTLAPHHPAAATTTINGQCSSTQNFATASVAPSTKLCNTGAATAVTGNGPWLWTCLGQNGGATATCETFVAAAVPLKVQLAAYAGFPDSVYPANQASATAGYNSLVTAIGQKPSMYLTYIDMTHPLSNWYWNTRWAVSSWQASPWLKGVTPVIGLPMGIVGDDGNADLHAIMIGAWDDTINQVFGVWADAGYTAFYLRPGWEMNGGWYPWSVNAGNAATFVGAFQHIVKLARKFTRANITIVWNPNVGSNAAIPMSSYYPGDAYVDVVGLDTYGAPLNSDNSPLFVSSSSADVELQMIMSFAKAHGKRFALPEVGGNDTAFPINLGYAVAQTKMAVDFMGLWDFGTSADLMAWSFHTNVAAAWKIAIAQIANAQVATPSVLAQVAKK